MVDRRIRRMFPTRGGDQRHPPATPDPLSAAEPDVTGTGRIIDLAIYRGGERIASPASLPELYRLLGDHDDSMAWIGMYRPSTEQINSLAEEFDLHELAVEDSIVAHQRPKLERYGDVLFVVLSAARYLDDVEEVEFGELHVFVGPNFVITMRHSESPDLTGVRARLEGEDRDLLAMGPEAVLYAVLDRVVDAYLPVVAGLENDIDEMEMQIFSGDPRVSRRIYELSREVIEFRRATHPLQNVLAGLEAGFDKYGVDEELQRYLRDVADHTTLVAERVDGFQQILRDMLTVNATLVAQRQNDEMRALTEASNEQNVEVKKISAYAAILFAPTLIGTVYGMNFLHMPELEWEYGYLWALGLMVVVCTVLWLWFRSKDWL